MSNHRLVYSTEIGRACPDCGRPQQKCICKKQPRRQTPPAFPVDGIIRIRREIQGRKGKAVSVIHGLVLDDGALNDLARNLKQRCGAGGTVKEGTIVIQGDHRETIREALAQRGFTVKPAGG
jgi:translation initiation factor 1